MTSQTGHAGLLLLGSTAGLFGLCLALVAASEEIQGETHTYFQVGYLLGLTAAVGGFLAYAMLTRQAILNGRLTPFDKQLQLRNFALNAVPAGVVCVAFALVWYAAKRMTDTWGDGRIDQLVVLVFGFLGTAFVVLMTSMAVSFERRALRRATEEVAGAVA